MNLGMDPLFADTANDVNPIVMNGISTGTSNHDFFSQVGNGYLLGTVEAMKDDDYLYGLDNSKKLETINVSSFYFTNFQRHRHRRMSRHRTKN